MRASDIESIYELSPLQQGLLFHSVNTPESGVYTVQFACVFQGCLDVDAFQQAWQRVLDRHAILRTSFHWKEVDKLLQVVNRSVDLPIQRLDHSSLTASEQELRLADLLSEDLQRGYDTSLAPLMRLILIRLSENESQFIWSHHHLIMDGWSQAILFKEVFELYDAFLRGDDVKLPPVPSFQNYISWLKQQSLSEAEAFWRKALLGFTRPTPVVADTINRNSNPDGGAFNKVEICFSSKLASELRSVARINQITLNTLIQGVWAIVLSRYSGDKDILYGVVVSGRPAEIAGVENIVGPFINTLPMRVRVHANASLGVWLKELQDQQSEMRRFEHSPLLQVQSWSEAPRGMPLFDSLFVFENYPIDASLQEESEALRVTGVQSNETTNYPLTVAVLPGKDLWLNLIYNSHYFTDAVISGILSQIQLLFEAVASNPHQRLLDLPLLSEKERRQVVSEWNQTGSSFPKSACIHHLFEDQAKRTPESVALIFEDQTLNYNELNSRANRLARHLQTLGVGPEALVGVCAERSIEIVVGLLAILKAGGAYVPLDPACPTERLAIMLEEIHAPVILVQKKFVPVIPMPDAELVILDFETAAFESHSSGNLQSAVSADNLAYVMYTSGSTGRPKGVSIIHRNVVRLVKQTNYATFNREDVLLLFAPITFDASTFEIWGSLLNGAKLVILPPPAQSLDEIGQAIRRFEISTLWLTASLFHTMVDECPEALQGVQQLLAGGDVLSATHVAHVLKNRIVPHLINGYGPTESTTFACCYRMDEVKDLEASVPIGKPISNTQVYLLNEDLQPVPIGIRGELYIGGDGLARNYLAQPGLTAERFIPDLVSGQAGARLYKTGDWARYLPDGRIEFLGRRDHQVKIRGFRIELGDIEATLTQHPKVRESIILVREDNPGEKRLVAYLTANSNSSSASIDGAESHAAKSALSIKALRQYLEDKLPDYMIPTAFVIMDTFPLSAHGKVDRHALPAPDLMQSASAGQKVRPRTPIEQRLVEIWSSVLRVQDIGIHDNFFELGGDSILNIQIVAKANRMGIKFTPRLLFQNPSIAALAAVVKDKEETVAEQGLVKGDVPLTPIQHWFFERELVNPQHFNQAVLLQLDPLVQPALLQQALNALLLHHDALRLCFSAASSSAWLQQVAPPQPFSLIHHDLSDLPAQRLPEAIDRYASLAHAAFDLASGLLLKALFFRLPPPLPPRLLLIIHHLAVDGLSWRILLEDLSTAYGQLVSQEAVNLGAKTNSYKEWASRLVEQAQEAGLAEQVAYWQEVVGCQVAALPVDKRGGENLVRTTAVVSRGLTEEETRGLLQEVPQAYHTQINEVLLTALLLAYEEWGGGKCLVVELEGHGRQEMKEGLDVTRTVGWFTTMHPVRLEKREGEEEVEVMKRVKEELRGVPEQGIGYGMLKYLSKDEEVRKRMREMVQAEMSFNYLGQFDGVGGDSALFEGITGPTGQHHSARDKRAHLIVIEGAVSNGRLELVWMYSKNIHRQSTIEKFAECYMEELRALIVHCKSPDAAGYTPSDFPYAKFSQAELDEVLAELNEVEE